ncbi:MAG: hypothetical protein SGPRY_014115, partial [Prymnesium sp.]
DGTVRVWNSESGVELCSHQPNADINGSHGPALYHAPPPSIVAFVEARKGGDSTEQRAMGILYVSSGALVSVLELAYAVEAGGVVVVVVVVVGGGVWSVNPLLVMVIVPSSLRLIACARVMGLDWVARSRGHSLPSDLHSLLLVARNHTLQLNSWADPNEKALIAPKPTKGAQPSSQARGPAALAPMAHTPELSACLYEPALGCVLACWDNGSIDLLDLPGAVAEEGLPAAPPLCLHTFFDKHSDRPVVDVCVLPVGSQPRLKARPPAVRGSFSAVDESEAFLKWVVVSGDTKGHVNLWSVGEADPLRSIAAHHESVVSLLPLHTAPQQLEEPPHAQLPEGSFASLMLSIAIDGSVCMWDTREFKFTLLGSLRAQYGITTAALRSRSTVLLGFDHGGIEVWRLPWPAREEGTWEAEGVGVLRASEQHHRRVNCIHCCPDAPLFLSASSDHTAVLWALDSFQVLRLFTFSAPPTSVRFIELEGGEPPAQFVVAIGENVNVGEAHLNPRRSAATSHHPESTCFTRTPTHPRRARHHYPCF